MNKPYISVIMSAYNEEKYIGEAIESILSQSYDNFEFIIINDGSTDSTGLIVRKYIEKDSRIVYLERKNMGLVKSLNQGIELASGKYIARMDADDISYKERLEKQVDYLINNTDIDILGTFIEVIGDDEKKVEYEKWFNKKINKNDFKEKLIEGCAIAHPSVMIKSDVLKELQGYREKYSKIEDYDLWLRALNYGFRISNFDEILLKYRVHEDSKSNVDRKNEFEYIAEKINMKLEHFYNSEKFSKYKVFIWGCGKGGELVYKCLNEKGISVVGFIDLYKTGEFMGKKIYNKEYLMNIEKSFTFIATSLGFKYAEECFKNINYENYLYVV